MKYLSILGLTLLLFSCTKSNETCVARTVDGQAKYEVKGRTICENQILADQNEYCDCED